MKISKESMSCLYILSARPGADAGGADAGAARPRVARARGAGLHAGGVVRAGRVRSFFCLCEKNEDVFRKHQPRLRTSQENSFNTDGFRLERRSMRFA